MEKTEGEICFEEERIADILEEAEVEGKIEGDFYEETFMEGTKIYIDRLRRKGAFIFSEVAYDKGKMCEDCGKEITGKECLICREQRENVVEALKEED